MFADISISTLLPFISKLTSLIKGLWRSVENAELEKKRRQFTKNEFEKILKNGCGLLSGENIEKNVLKRGRYFGKRKKDEPLFVGSFFAARQRMNTKT